MRFGSRHQSDHIDNMKKSKQKLQQELENPVKHFKSSLVGAFACFLLVFFDVDL